MRQKALRLWLTIGKWVWVWIYDTDHCLGIRSSANSAGYRYDLAPAFPAWISIHGTCIPGLGSGKGIIFQKHNRATQISERGVRIGPPQRSWHWEVGSGSWTELSTHCEVQPGERALLCNPSHASRSCAKVRGCSLQQDYFRQGSCWEICL